ncbi:hypothetical protein EON64_20965 [archaeon]|nr:MAG: hypothetical protein EON64_20965 [archaeon]
MYFKVHLFDINSSFMNKISNNDNAALSGPQAGEDHPVDVPSYGVFNSSDITVKIDDPALAARNSGAVDTEQSDDKVVHMDEHDDQDIDPAANGDVDMNSYADGDNNAYADEDDTSSQYEDAQEVFSNHDGNGGNDIQKLGNEDQDHDQGDIVEPYNDPNEEDGSIPLETGVEGKGVVVKTSTRQTVFLPVPGLVRANEVKPGELVGVNKV